MEQAAASTFRWLYVVSGHRVFVFGYLDKILCFSPNARPSVGTAFPLSQLPCAPSMDVWALAR